MYQKYRKIFTAPYKMYKWLKSGRCILAWFATNKILLYREIFLGH